MIMALGLDLGTTKIKVLALDQTGQTQDKASSREATAAA